MSSCGSSRKAEECKMAEKWVTRWRLEVSVAPVLPGIWKLRGGGFVACAQVRDPKRRHVRGTRPKYKTVFAVLREAQTSKDALDWLAAERKRIEDTDPLSLEIPIWKDFATLLVGRKISTGDIQSAAGAATYKSVLARIIATAAWANLPLNEVRHRYIQAWRDELPNMTWTRERRLKTGEVKVVATGKYGPRSLNTWLALCAVIWKAATARFELARNPYTGVRHFSTKTARTYTREEPNALNPRTEVAEFLARFKRRFPQWYAFVIMGFVLGQRPSTLRPLRRKGPHADLDLVAKKLYIRRSNAIEQAIMDTTKTGDDLELSLPDDLIEVLKDHIAALEADPVCSKSEFLFPSRRSGKMYSKSCLKDPFRTIMKEMGLKRKLTPRGMRRTYQDLADEAKLRAVTTMAVSGHKSQEMKLLYSTAHEDEIREGIGKVIDLATARKRVSGEPKS
jgi:hypothetical protein